MSFDFAHPWNLVYAIPFGLGVLLVLVSITGAGRHNRGAVRHGARMSTPRMSTHGSHGGAHKHHGAKANTRGATKKNALHLGDISPLMLAQNFLLFWGVIGWAAQGAMSRGAHDATRFIVPSLLTAAVGASVLSLFLSGVLARLTPPEESAAIARNGLEGCAGEAVSLISATSGSVYVRDASGTLHHIAARVAPECESLPKGAPVLVVSYEDGECYRVKRWSPDEA